MKKIVLLTALALPLAFAACTNDDFVNEQVASNNNGKLIELDKTFALGVQRGGAETRAEYNISTNGNLVWDWMPRLDVAEETSDNKGDGDSETSASTVTPAPNRIGVCWTGQTPDGRVYTNYEFTNFAWAVKDKTPNLEKCDGNKWNHLVFFDQGLMTELGTTISGADVAYVTEWKKNADDGISATISDSKEADKTSGYFRTTLNTIFEGDYLLYTPYNEEFYKSDNLVATSSKTFNVYASNDAEALGYASYNSTRHPEFVGIADEMFCVGTSKLQGGTTVNGFTLSPVSGMIRVRLSKGATVDEDWNEIKKVAIYGPEGIVTQQAIDGTKVAAAQSAGDMSKCLVDGDVRETSTTLIATLINKFNVTTATTDIIIPALPQTITNAQIVLFDEDGKSCMINTSDIVVKPNSFANVNISLTAGNALQTDVFYVVDMPTFADAMHQSYSKTDAATLNVQVKLLNDIVYQESGTDDNNGEVLVNKNMTLSGGKIIVPNDNSLTMMLNAGKTLTVNNEVEIQGKNCCGSTLGSVVIGGTNAEACAYVFNESVTNYGSFQIGKHGSATKATFNGEVKNLTGAADEENNDGKEVITVSGKTTATFNAKVTNEGKFVTDRNFNDAADNGTVANISEFDNNGKIEVGKKTTLNLEQHKTLTNNGTIEVESNHGTDNKLDGTINNEGSIVNNNVISNKGVINTYGTLANEAAGSEIYDYVGCQFGGNSATVPEGTEYICDVDNSKKTNGDRLAYALNDQMRTTIVRFVKGTDTGAEHNYDLKDYKDYTKLATVKYIIDTEIAGDANSIGDFKIWNSLKDEDGNPVELTFGKEIVVEKARDLKFCSGKIKVGGPVTVKTGFMQNEQTGSYATVVTGTITMNGTEMAVKTNNTGAATQTTAANWTVNGDVVLSGSGAKIGVAQKAAFYVKSSTATEGNLTIGEGASAVFGYSSYTDINKKVTINGTFTRELSSGTATANPAKVWCESFSKGSKATITNGLPETR